MILNDDPSNPQQPMNSLRSAPGSKDKHKHNSHNNKRSQKHNDNREDNCQEGGDEDGSGYNDNIDDIDVCKSRPCQMSDAWLCTRHLGGSSPTKWYTVALLDQWEF